MARPKGYDRDAVLVAARDLFWEQGYERASIADLEKRTGLNRSSIYQEFGSKRELFSAALSATPTALSPICSPACATTAGRGWMPSPRCSSALPSCSAARPA